MVAPLNVPPQARVLGVAFVGEAYDLGVVSAAPFKLVDPPRSVERATIAVDGHLVTFTAPGKYLLERATALPSGARVPERFYLAVFHREALAVRGIARHAHGGGARADGGRGILLSIARHHAIDKLTPDHPVPGCPLQPHGGDHGT